MRCQGSLESGGSSQGEVILLACPSWETLDGDGCAMASRTMRRARCAIRMTKQVITSSPGASSVMMFGFVSFGYLAWNSYPHLQARRWLIGG